jgi:hypothetical protein
MAKMIQVPYKTKRYFTNDDYANLIYFQVPKLLMYGESYKKMSADGKLFYVLCLDLIKLSMKKGWKDEYGRYYIKMSLETIKERMDCQNTKAVNLKKELVKYELMEVVRIGQGKADRLYILQLEYTEEDIYKANNDHQDIENDEFQNSENQRTLQPQENSENRISRTLENGGQELRKSETIKNLSINNKSIKSFDDDKRTSPTGEDPAIRNDAAINLMISNFREATKEDISERSFKSVVRKVFDKHSQGKVNSFRDYLATALTKKIDELEFRRQKDNARQQLMLSAEKMKIENKLNGLDTGDVPFYNWLEE